MLWAAGGEEEGVCVCLLKPRRPPIIITAYPARPPPPPKKTPPKQNSNIFADAGVEWQYYKYFDAGSVGLDFKGMCGDLEAAPEGSVVLLHGE